MQASPIAKLRARFASLRNTAFALSPVDYGKPIGLQRAA
jgi:hypothetical protein